MDPSGGHGTSLKHSHTLAIANAKANAKAGSGGSRCRGDLLEHHLPHGGGDGLAGAVVPDELGVLVRPLEDVHGRLGVVPHGVHEHAGQEADQRQTHLQNSRRPSTGETES